MGMIENQHKFSRMLFSLFDYLFSQGYEVRFGDAWRSTDKLAIPETSKKYSYQELLVHNGKSKIKYGKHNDRLAVDLIIHKNGKQLISEEYKPIGEKWEIIGGMWGGRFGIKKEEYNIKVGWDSSHFEL